MSRRRSPRRAAALAVAALVAVGGLAACGDDDDGPTTTTVSPESIRVPMSEVLAGLPRLVDHGTAAASAGNTGDYTTAQAEYEELIALWLTVEGTIKATDPDVYIRMETAQSLIHNGADTDNAERIQQGADDQAAAAVEFLADHG